TRLKYSCRLKLASGQLSVEQSPEWRGVFEGQNGTVTCTYSSAINSLHWYRQAPGERPLFLLILHGKGSETQEPNFTADHDPGQKRSSLHIRGCHLGDTARYLCAVETQ
uniref:Ig-like domain-containing protein n=1 Tax=Gopherus agassizii TaxID=38772 RepID=A0A452H0Q1_9SAUR